jgi:Arc/MetJ-type ribon-helix-helix transcriptional regulator
MSTGLSPENDNYIDLAVATGLFQNRDQAINTAVELLKRREGLIREVNSGIEQLEKGLGEPFDIETIMAEIDEQLSKPGE